MKKLDYNHLTTGTLTVDASHLIGVVNGLIDLVNSQQEAIGELQTEIGVLRNMVLQSQEAIEKLQEHVDHEARHVSEPADDKPHPSTIIPLPTDTHRTDKVSARDMASRNPSPEAKKALESAVQQSQDDMNKMSTHRTVTLRIPRGMTIGRTILEAMGSSQSSVLSKSDTDLQKALDEVEHE